MKGPYLEVHSGATHLAVPLDQPRVTIGRHAANNVVLNDTRASRAHCVIEQLEDGTFQVRDMKSVNGTLVNGFPIEVAPLTLGDVITVGSATLTYLYSDDDQPDVLTAEDIVEEENDEALVPVENEFAEPGGMSHVAKGIGYEPALQALSEALPDRSFGENDVMLINARGGLMHQSAGQRRPGDRREAVDLFRLLLLVCFRGRATDIHIEPRQEQSTVRLRIDGGMVEVGHLPEQYSSRLLSLVKVMCDIDIAHRNVIQEGRFAIRVPDRLSATGQRQVDCRVSFAPSVFGQKLVIRLLDAANAPLRAGDLNLPRWMLTEVATAIREDSGMVLTCGPTGSGKTTTLYSLVRSIDVTRRNVVTIEDPVEIQVEGVTQIPVRDDQDSSFPQLLRSVLRQDPDVILVGEVRDAETARVAMQAAVTGHLVFSTVHTKDTIGCIFRLIDLGVEPYLVAQGLHLVLAQRLVRQLCPYCKKPVQITDEQRKEMGTTAEGVTTIYAPGGCLRCLNTGFAGRRACFELLRVNAELRDVIIKTPTMVEITNVLSHGQFQPLRQNGYQLVADGLVSYTEVERTVGREH